MTLKKNTLRVGGILAVLTAALTAYFAYQPQPPESPVTPVVEIRRDNLVLRGDVPKEFLSGVFDLLTAVDQSLRKEFPFLSPQTFKMDARFFAVSEEYQTFVASLPKRLYDREACWVETSGGTGEKKFSVGVNCRGGVQRARQLMAHEYAHLLLNSGMRYPPLWLDEGLGLYTEGCVSETGYVSRSVNEQARRTAQKAVSENRFLPLGELLSLTHKDDNKLTEIPYYQCWSVFYFLYFKNENAGAFQTFCRNYHQHYEEPLYFFEQTFQTTAAEMETHWRAFAK